MHELDNESSQLSVLDLPQLHSKPPFSALHQTLASLAIGPASWDLNSAISTSIISGDGVPAYLTKLISSPLNWLSTDEEREAIWEEASKRLSERSGRTAMSSFERIFTIPTVGSEADDSSSVEIKIHEPALTGDQLGHKTWLGAFVLAKKLPVWLKTQSAHHNPAPLIPDSPLHVLELGAGTGLAGLAAAALFPPTTYIHLTDLPEIIPNLQANINGNAHLLADPDRVTADVLDWSQLPTTPSQLYNCILAADSLYSSAHPRLLTDAMALFLKREPHARIFTVLPFRDMDRDYHAELRIAMTAKGFGVRDEGTELGVEDWYRWREREVVKCWWCVWAWGDAILAPLGGRDPQGLSQDTDGCEIPEDSNASESCGDGVMGDEGDGVEDMVAWEELCVLIPEMREIR